MDGVEPEGFSIADVLYDLQYPAFVLGLLLMPSRGGRADAGRMLLDVLTMSTGVLVVMWHAILGPAWAAYTTESPYDLLFAAGPVVGDLGVLTAIAAVLFRGPDPPTRAALVFLSAGIFAYVAGDLAYVYASMDGSYASGSPIDIGWLSAMLLFGIAAQRQRADSGIVVAVGWADSAVDWLSRVLPYFGMALGMGMLLGIAGDRSEGVTRITVGGAALMCALILLRQSLAALHTTRLNRALELQNLRLLEETDKSERLLLNIFPASIAAKLKHGRPAQPVADRFSEVTVMFADIVGFTALSANTPPEALLTLLDDVFVRFDTLAERHGLEKIKTIGDAYMAVAGVPAYRIDHAEATVEMGLAMQRAMAEISAERGVDLTLRVGVHTGPVVAGVIGHRKFSYDLWGDTVNTASRMESHGVPGRVQVSETTALRIKQRFQLDDRGIIEVKGKGSMHVWIVGEPTAPPSVP
jgi:class 3 adenylate cyclase